MDERGSRDLNLEPISSSFLVEHILKQSESKSFEAQMENTEVSVKGENATMDYESLTGSGENEDFTGLSCMVAEAEIKGARQFVKGMPVSYCVSFQLKVVSSAILSSYCCAGIMCK